MSLGPPRRGAARPWEEGGCGVPQPSDDYLEREEGRGRGRGPSLTTEYAASRPPGALRAPVTSLARSSPGLRDPSDRAHPLTAA